MRVWFVLGTAAELIKMFPVIDGTIRRSWDYSVLVTGQSGVNFWNQYDDFRLDRAHAIELVSSEKDLERVSSAAAWARKSLIAGRRKWKSLLAQAAPEFVFVHGDTLSCGLGAFLGSRSGVKVVHVEAGLRSPHWFQPFPEELTRRMVSRWASWHFAPDETAASNLRLANVRGEVVPTGGNTLADAVQWAHRHALPVNIEFDGLVNIHRFENLNSSDRWEKIIESLLQAARRWRLVMVIHPQTKYKLQKDREAETKLRQSGVLFLERLPFTGFVSVLEKAKFLITDGGSNQEETYYLGKPCLILRNATERTEGLGETAVLSKFDSQSIESFIADPLRFAKSPRFPARPPTEIILQSLAESGRA